MMFKMMKVMPLQVGPPSVVIGTYTFNVIPWCDIHEINVLRIAVLRILHPDFPIRNALLPDEEVGKCPVEYPYYRCVYFAGEVRTLASFEAS